MKAISQMNQLQIRDALTNLFNRRFIDERLPIDIVNHCNSDYDLSIILADIDYFKRVNDTFGHVAGDFVLKEFAQILSGFANDKEHWVARYGGEEFLMVRNNSSLEESEALAEQIRRKVESHQLIFEQIK